VGAVVILRLGPLGLLRPRWSFGRARGVLRFGAQVQGALVVTLVRDQALNAGIALIAGVATLGVWSLAWRVLQIPFMVVGTIGRIAFPAMARLIHADADPRPAIERGSASVSVLGGVPIVALVAFAPALPLVLGPGWHDVPPVLLIAGLTMIASAPIVLGSTPYLLAAGASRPVLVAAIVASGLWLAIALALVGTLGAPAGAVGWAVGAAVQIVMLTRETTRRSGAALLSSAGPPTVIAMAAAGLGWLVTKTAGSGVAAGLVGATAGELVLLATLGLVCPGALRDVRRLTGEAAASFIGRRRARPQPSADSVRTASRSATS
jgi:O-antigen/teichoic acid export membrane protein